MRIGAAKYILLVALQSTTIDTAYCKLAIPTKDDGATTTMTSRHQALSSLLKQQASVKDQHKWLISNVEGAFDMFTSAREVEEQKDTIPDDEKEEDTIPDDEEDEEDEEEVDENHDGMMEGKPDRRHRHRRAKAKSKKARMKLQQCLADLKECQDEEHDETSMLAVQMGNKCSLKRHHGPSSGLFKDDGGYEYELFIENMNDNTFLFSDRPYTVENVESTKVFIDKFDDTFKDDRPNAAVTFTKSAIDDVTDTPLVSVFLEAAYEQDTPPLSVTYRLHQSSSQASVVSLESYFTDDQDETMFDDCSIFIDSLLDVPDCPLSCQTEEYYWGTGSAELDLAMYGKAKSGPVYKCCNELVPNDVCYLNQDGNTCNCPKYGSACKISPITECSLSCQGEEYDYGSGFLDTVKQCCYDVVGFDADCYVNHPGSTCKCPKDGSRCKMRVRPPSATIPECPDECQHDIPSLQDLTDRGYRVDQPGVDGAVLRSWDDWFIEHLDSTYAFYDIIRARKCCEKDGYVGTKGGTCYVNDQWNECTCPYHQGPCYIDTRCDPFMTWVDGECKIKPGFKCGDFSKLLYETNQPNCPMLYEYKTSDDLHIPGEGGYCGSDGGNRDCTSGYRCDYGGHADASSYLTRCRRSEGKDWLP